MIKNDVASIGIYPEGGTNRTEETVLPLHSGSFKIAQKAGEMCIRDRFCAQPASDKCIGQAELCGIPGGQKAADS